MKYVLHIEGMKIELPEKIATDDAAIRTAFVEVRPEYGDVSLTKISRELIPDDGVHIRFIQCTTTDGAEEVTEPIASQLAASEAADALTNSAAVQPDALIEIAAPAVADAAKADADDLIVDASRSDLTEDNAATAAAHEADQGRPSDAASDVRADAIAHALMTPVEPAVSPTVAATPDAEPDGAGDEDDEDGEGATEHESARFCDATQAITIMFVPSPVNPSELVVSVAIAIGGVYKKVFTPAIEQMILPDVVRERIEHAEASWDALLTEKRAREAKAKAEQKAAQDKRNAEALEQASQRKKKKTDMSAVPVTKPSKDVAATKLTKSKTGAAIPEPAQDENALSLHSGASEPAPAADVTADVALQSQLL